jgi:hypothetical protein
MIFLSGCSSSPPAEESPQGKPLLRLSTVEDENFVTENGKTETKETPESDQTRGKQVEEVPTEKDSETSTDKSTPKEEQTAELEEPPVLGYGIPQENPGDQKDSQEIAEAETNKSVATGNFQLPYQDFKDRWNAISEEQASNLTIFSLTPNRTETDTFYQTSLNERLTLKIFLSNKKVQKLHMVGNGRTKPDILSMLTSWSQVVYMMNPEAEPHEIDHLFNELGVGPNSNLEDVQDRTVIQGGIQYKVTSTETGYQFEASYPEE